MRQQLIDLTEIQKIDLSIREVEKRQEELPQRLRELEANLESLQGQISALEGQRDALVAEAKAVEGHVQEETLKIRKWEARLNEIRNQREYLALSREIEAGKRSVREQEERLAALKKQRDESSAQFEELQDRLGVVGVDCADEQERVSAALAALNAEVAEETARRERLFPALPKALLRKYENIRSKRAGVGIVAVSDGCCTGCNMRLPPQLYNILQRINSIEQCPSCQRIIYWDRLTEENNAVAEENVGYSASV